MIITPLSIKHFVRDGKIDLHLYHKCRKRKKRMVSLEDELLSITLKKQNVTEPRTQKGLTEVLKNI